MGLLALCFGKIADIFDALGRFDYIGDFSCSQNLKRLFNIVIPLLGEKTSSTT